MVMFELKKRMWCLFLESFGIVFCSECDGKDILPSCYLSTKSQRNLNNTLGATVV